MLLLVFLARSLSAALHDGVEDDLRWLTPGSLDGTRGIPHHDRNDVAFAQRDQPFPAQGLAQLLQEMHQLPLDTVGPAY